MVQRTCAGEHAPAATSLLLAWTEAPSVIPTVSKGKGRQRMFLCRTACNTAMHSALHMTGAQQCRICGTATTSNTRARKASRTACTACSARRWAVPVPAACRPRGARARQRHQCHPLAPQLPVRPFPSAPHWRPPLLKRRCDAAPTRPALREPGPQAAACLGRRRDAYLRGRQLVGTSCADGAPPLRPLQSALQTFAQSRAGCSKAGELSKWMATKARTKSGEKLCVI